MGVRHKYWSGRKSYMNRVLVRMGMLPLESLDIDEILRRDLIGNNSGNLIYQNGIYRTLYTNNSAIDIQYVFRNKETDADMERINSEYDRVILPLANVFRSNFPIRPLADFIKRLRIPCVAMGVGLQARTVDAIKNGFSYDGDAKALISALLEKSSMVGLRGEYTAEYLEKLGFIPEKHFTITGCPSMFTWGKALPQPHMRDTLDCDASISINLIERQPHNLNRLMAKTIAEYEKHYLVLQTRSELNMLRYGSKVTRRTLPCIGGNTFYPHHRNHPEVTQGHAIGFVDAPSWFEYYKDIDFSFGSRIHGNLSAVLNGVPAFVFTTDTRTEELCRYHHVPHMNARSLAKNANIRGIYETAEFESVLHGHEERFRHFVDFLNKNEVNHIYKDTDEPHNVPYDSQISKAPYYGKICYDGLISEERRIDGKFAYDLEAKQRYGLMRSIAKRLIKR